MIPAASYLPIPIPPVYTQPLPPPKTLRLIGWCPPPPGWVKVNTDGAYKKSLNIASAGGLLRDHNGKWLGGFAMNLSADLSALEAEFTGILGGLELAWKLGYRRVILESDCKVAIDFLIASESNDHLVRSIKELLGRKWIVKVQFEYREANQAADWLANLGIQLPTGYHEFQHPPLDIFNHIIEDSNGVKYPRICPADRI